jgi:branched-chain amino acid transport system ATP-binding protein
MPLLAVEGVRKSFGGLGVLSGVDFELGEGEILSLIGPNGAGKTTLFNIVSGLLPADAGRVVFDGVPVEGEPAYLRSRRGIGRTFQHPRLFRRLSVLENVMVGGFRHNRDVGWSEAEAVSWLTRLGLGGRLLEDVESLTLLQRKSLEVARAMAARPRLLLLDELMAGLNPTELENAIAVVKAIQAGGTTVLLIEHVMTAVMTLSHRVVVLADGQIIARGTPAEVTTNPAVLRAYLGERYRAYTG